MSILEFLNGAIKIYLPDSDIYNPRNWEKKDEKCEGIIFGDINEISIDVGNLFTSKLVLPTHGQIEFNKITFGKKSECESILNKTKIIPGSNKKLFRYSFEVVRKTQPK